MKHVRSATEEHHQEMSPHGNQRSMGSAAKEERCWCEQPRAARWSESCRKAPPSPHVVGNLNTIIRNVWSPCLPKSERPSSMLTFRQIKVITNIIQRHRPTANASTTPARRSLPATQTKRHYYTEAEGEKSMLLRIICINSFSIGADPDRSVVQGSEPSNPKQQLAWKSPRRPSSREPAARRPRAV